MKKKKYDQFESEMIQAYEKGELISTPPSKPELEKFRSAARLTFVRDRRVNIRLTSPDLMDIQARALEEGIPYQILNVSVLHKFVSGRLVEKTSSMTSRLTGPEIEILSTNFSRSLNRRNHCLHLRVKDFRF